MKSSMDFVYNPDNQTKEQLIDGFVVRQKTFQRLFADIKTAKMQSPEQHYIIEGKRGMGKTTLLLRLGYEIENNDDLNPWLIPIVFNEEEYSVRRLYKLWERIAILLEEKDSRFIGLYDEMDKSFASYAADEDYEQAVFSILNKRLEKEKKKLILFIDNFGDIFSKFNIQEVQQLRTVLQTNSNFRIFGASSSVLEAFYDNKHPFFDFFKITRLQGLNKEETKDLMLKLGEAFGMENINEIIETQSGKIEALRRLTGGVIRTIVLLFEIFIDQKQGSTFSDLESILDRVTPLYKHRMDDLSSQQQEIVEALAFAWDAISVNDISQKTRIISKTISAQLNQMEKNEIITKKLTNTKNHFYQISERFFNIWYLMRHGRKGDKRKVLWLVRFLEEWCDKTEILARTNQHIVMLKNGKYDVNGAYYLTEALASTKFLPTKSQDELIKAARDFLNINKSEFANHLSESKIELFDKFKKAFKQRDYKEALKWLLKTKIGDGYLEGYCYYKVNDLKNAESSYSGAIKKGNTAAMIGMGILHRKKNQDFAKAAEYFDMAASKGDTNAMMRLGFMYDNDLKNPAKAEEYYLMAEQKGDNLAAYSLGVLYQSEFKNYKKAIKYYLKAIKNDDHDALVSLGYLYDKDLNDYSKAKEYYLQAINMGNDDALFTLAFMLDRKLKDYVQAEKYYLQSIDKGNVEAITKLGTMYEDSLEDYVRAKEYYLQAIEKGSEDAIVLLANLFADKFENYLKAEEYYLLGIKKDNEDAMLCLAMMYDDDLGDFEKAEKYYLMAAKKGNLTAMNNLAYIYYVEKNNSFKALELSQKSYEMDNNDASRLTYAKALLWNDKFDESKKIATEFLYDENYLTKYLDYYTDYLYLLLAKQQHKFLFDFFTNQKGEELSMKDRLKPIWYVLMHLLKNEYPNEYLRMGEELNETVVELIEKVEKMKVEYKI